MPDLDDTAPPRPDVAEAGAPAGLGSAATAFEPTIQLSAASRPVPGEGFSPAGDAEFDEPVETSRALELLCPDGTRLPLDRTVIVGRRPAPPRVARDEPVLVTVDSPRREISASHLELRPVGRTVVASDLRSSNGSRVALPGSRARPLARGESLVVGAGTSIDLGDGVVLRILEADAGQEGSP
ncbi:MAG: FHA domain-containing protein [Actinomycetales bacterium]|nr:FHA domain-containing protein [Actinomycetales bacterium]